MGLQSRIAVLGPDPDECQQIQEWLRDGVAQVDAVPLREDGGYTMPKKAYHAYVFCLPDGFAGSDTSFSVQAPALERAILYVMSNPSEEDRRWAYRHGAGGILLRPVSAHELRYRVDSLMAARPAHIDAITDEESLLSLLRHLLESGVELIEPSLDPDAHWGHSYPDVAAVLGKSAGERECLETLTSEGLLSATLVNWVHVCPECSDYRTNFRETCPNCGSHALSRHEAIHHFACAYVGTIESFRQGPDLICPKCRETLRQIGRDYEKPGTNVQCDTCERLFAEPTVEGQCVNCAERFPPDRSAQQPIYAYRLTPLASEAVEEGRIGGISLASLLKSEQTGLYSRQYLLHELRREMARCARYGQEFCVFAIRLDGFDEVLSRHATRAREYAIGVFGALSHRLRVLDTTSAWNRDTLAVLLTATPLDGAKVVASRMQHAVTSLDHLRSIHEPSVTIGIVEYDKRYTTAEAMIDDALHELD